MQPMVRITEITPQQFWGAGYRWGYDDGSNGRPHMLDGPPGDVIADVIPLRGRMDDVSVSEGNGL